MIVITIQKREDSLSHSFTLDSSDSALQIQNLRNHLPVFLSWAWLAAVSNGRVSELLINDSRMRLLRSQASGQLLRWGLILGWDVLLALASVCVGPGCCCPVIPILRVLGEWPSPCCRCVKPGLEARSRFHRDQSVLLGSITSACSLVPSIKWHRTDHWGSVF